MATTKKPNKEVKDWGFSLTEVLVALVVIGIILTFSLRLFTEQWRLTREVKDQMEAHFAVLNAGRTVLDDIRAAQTVDWDNNGVLRILPWTQGASHDFYYIADKDYDGVKDLYLEHKGVPNPVTSRIISWKCTKGEAGLWTVTLQAQVGQQTVNWTGKSRQRTFLPPQL
ncbi:type II secretion system protein [Desulfitobacterium sp.]|uniref:PilW family protein n=1 Tax=Desulfitobacterium sp. TaxID=49981 RepID=UPI002C4A2EF9|nr:type II secretion system protein [Desulfitobacterium sp.]HVJ48893.1 type II secretion system protein [Desulfitobacterium sp.]